MNGNGIIRRVDEMGRIVIPKDMRRNFGIREGDPLEINVEAGRIIVTPYRPEQTYVDELLGIFLCIEDEREPRYRDALDHMQAAINALTKAGDAGRDD